MLAISLKEVGEMTFVRKRPDKMENLESQWLDGADKYQAYFSKRYTFRIAFLF